MSTQPWALIAVVVAAFAVAWKMEMLPQSIQAMLPDPKMSFYTTAPATPATSTAKPKCEEFLTEKQCGMYPDACEWYKLKCRSRELTPQEKA